MIRVRGLLLWAAVFLASSLSLFLPPFIGLADNSDYARVLQPLGFIPNEHPRYLHAFREFHLTDAAAGSVFNLILPPVENELGYVSSQFLVQKTALLLHYAVSRWTQADADVFDIRYLGFLYLLLYSIGLALFIRYIGAKKLLARALAFALALFMFCDTGYLLYLNSFYGEALILVAALLIAGSAAWTIYGNPSAKLPIVLFYVSSALFVSAKVANAPIGILLAVFGCAFVPLRKEKAVRVGLIAGSLALVLFSAAFFSAAPQWMKQVNHYQAIFFGVLKDSPSPAEDVKELGIPLKYAALHGTHGYMPNPPYDIYGDSFQAEVYDRASHAELLRFYLSRPGRFAEKLRVSAEAGVFLRPSYLGNFEPSASEGRFAFAQRISLWEELRKRTVGFAFPLVIAGFAGFALGMAYTGFRLVRKRSVDRRAIAALVACALLWTAAAIQFVVPIVGNGEADLQKHMFSFTVCFDLMLFVSAVWAADRIRLRHAAAAAFVLLPMYYVSDLPEASPVSADATVQAGDTVRLGTYNDRPLLWTVLAVDEHEGYFLWSSDVVDAKAFDSTDGSIPPGVPPNYGSNDWESSDLRAWLNADFLEAFGDEERRLLKPVKLRTLLPAAQATRKQSGDQPHYWSSIPLRIEQNYDRAYARFTTDLVFPLDAQQLQRVIAERGLPLKKEIPYWVRTPYAGSASMVRMVGEDGFVYHRDADRSGIGVVPALYVKPEAAVASGLGTAASPYVLDIKKTAE